MLSIHCTSFFAFAQHFTGPIAGGVGGAGVAAVDRGQEAFLNPASLPHTSPYTSSVFFRNGRMVSSAKTRDMGIMVVDNTDEIAVPGALGYIHRKVEHDSGERDDLRYLSLSAGSFLYNQFSAGISYTYASLEREGQGLWKEHDWSLGLLWNPHPDWAIGYSRLYIAKPKSDLLPALDLPETSILGANWIPLPNIRFRADIVFQHVRNPQKEWVYRYGVETFANDYNILRVGFENDGLLDKDYYTLGWGLNGPRLRIDYSYRKNIKVANEALHGVDLRMSF